MFLGIFSYNSAFKSIKETATNTSMETLKQVNKNIELTMSNFEEISNQIFVDSQIQNYLITDGIEVMDSYKNSTVAAIHSISSVSEEIAAATEEVSASTEEQLSAIDELLAFAKELDESAQSLNESIKRFKI